MESAQFWIALAIGVGVFSFTTFMIGMFLGIRIGRREDYTARDALSVGNGGTGRIFRRP